MTSTMTRQQDIQDALCNRNIGPFGCDLAGYASSAAAADLLAHWETCDPPLETIQKLGDIDEVLSHLREWRKQVEAVNR